MSEKKPQQTSQSEEHNISFKYIVYNYNYLNWLLNYKAVHLLIKYCNVLLRIYTQMRKYIVPQLVRLILAYVQSNEWRFMLICRKCKTESYLFPQNF